MTDESPISFSFLFFFFCLGECIYISFGFFFLFFFFFFLRGIMYDEKNESVCKGKGHKEKNNTCMHVTIRLL